MSNVTLLIIGFGLLMIAALVAFVLAFWDWRAWLRRKLGNSYKKGLAHIKYGGQWVYRESRLMFEGDDAITYTRKLDDSDEYTADIVPNDCGFAYNENTGRRVYRGSPGGGVCTSDDGDAAAVNYPSELISPHVMDRVVIAYNRSVSAPGGVSMGWVLIGVLALVLVIGGLFATGTIKIPGAAPARTASANTTAPAPAPAPSPGGGIQFQSGGAAK